MKKALAWMLTALCALNCLFPFPALGENKKINIVTTIFPIYDWTRQLVQDNDQAEITMLLDSGADLHNYQPTAPDILKIATADLFIFVGGESDDWTEDVLRSSMNPDMKVINLLQALGEDVKEEETVEGMEAEPEEDGEEKEADEHIWLSLRNAGKLCRAIGETLCEIDPDNQENYRARLQEYLEKLEQLDAAYVEMTEAAEVKTVLFGDRFPFRYMMDDYGLTYYAAFSGCSAESEASFATVMFLTGKVDELGLKTVLTIENPKTRLAETIVQNTKTKDQRIVAMNSLQSVTAETLKTGVTYLQIMEENLNALAQALQ